MQELEARDRELLEAIQIDIPLISTPWAAVGQAVDLSEKDVIKRVEKMRRARVIRSIRGVFAPRSLGYVSALVAVAAPDERLETMASTINLHPAVTQNYQRNHRFNLWFSILLPRDSRLGLEHTVSLLTRGAEEVLILPTEATFGASGEETAVEPRELSAEEIAVVRALQDELPGVPRPFDLLGRQRGIDGSEIVAIGARLAEERRFRGVIAVAEPPRSKAFAAHVMVAWRPAEDATSFARRIAQRPEFSRAWIRATRPGWPYAVFSTIHGRTVDECQAMMEEVSGELGVHDFVMMFPLREFKRSRIECFGDDAAAWEAEHARAQGLA